MKMLRWKKSSLAALSGLLTACGYGFSGGGSVLPPEIKSIYIPMVTNNTTESTLTPVITEALRDRFDRFGVVTVVDTYDAADAVLEVKILRVKRGTRTSVAGTDAALQLDTQLTLFGELRQINGNLLWREPEISVSRSFGNTRSAVVASSADFANSTLGSSDLSGLTQRELSRNQEQEALTQLADVAAKRIYDESVAPDF